MTAFTLRRGSFVIGTGTFARPTRFLSVCSGIEAASVAWKPIGWVHSVCLGSDPIFAHELAMPLTTRNGDPGVIAFSAKDYGADASVELSPTLGHTGSHANAGVMPAIVQTVALRGREGGGTAESTALRASQGGGDKPHVLLTSAVRRLTPRECERLMGFQFLVDPTYPGAWADASNRFWSPDYTQLPGHKADGPRYKALGNSWAVPKFRWLGERFAAVHAAAFRLVGSDYQLTQPLHTGAVCYF
jgi:site-specific DNA-cytosine methylase